MITNISYAHIKNFNNLNQIARAKGEIIDNITYDGTMIINMDDKYYKYFFKKCINRQINIFTYSKKNHNADIVFLVPEKKKKLYNRYKN